MGIGVSESVVFHPWAILMGTDPVREEDFRYPGPKPQSRESGIISLADAVESTSRSLVNPTPASDEEFAEFGRHMLLPKPGTAPPNVPRSELAVADGQEALDHLNAGRVPTLCLIDWNMPVLDGLQAEGEAAVLVHWALSEDILGLHRARQAMDEGKPLPMALRELRVWGPRERLFERALPNLKVAATARLVHAASIVDGIAKGLPNAAWPHDLQATSAGESAVRHLCAWPRARRRPN